MPVEHALPPAHDLSQQDPQQPQIKLCYACKCPLSNEPAAPFSLLDNADPSAVDPSPVCASCRSRLPAPAREGLFAEVERELLRRAASLQPAGNEAPTHEHGHTRQSQAFPSPPSMASSPSQDVTMDAHSPQSRAHVFEPHNATPFSHPLPARLPQSSSTTSSFASRPSLTPIDTSSSSQAPVAQRPELASISRSANARQRSYAASPDPLLDITHLRVRSQGHHCLYPGASFQGTQKSGRNSYEVNVTIVVCFVPSFLPATG